MKSWSKEVSKEGLIVGALNVEDMFLREFNK